jgi:DNA ligase (NAD+)
MEPPKHCPSCNGPLTLVKDQLYCTNTECGDRQYKKVEHFSSTLKIKGLGPAAIRKLDIRNFYDIYTVDTSPLGIKLADKLNEEIEKSKSAPLNLVLPALGIPLVGSSAADKLSALVNTLQEVTPEICREAGLGEKATNNLTEFLQKFNYDLPFNYTFAKKSATNGVVCISGKLISFKNKDEAKKVLEAKGYIVKPSVTKEVTILVNESGIESAKTLKARESGVRIINNLTELLGD